MPERGPAVVHSEEIADDIPIRAGPGAAATTLVVLAASAGGLEPVSTILRALPAGLRAAVIVLQHHGHAQRDMLTDILVRRTAMHVRLAHAGDVLRGGTAYVAPGDHDLHLTPSRQFLLTAGAAVGVCPSADVLIGSAAAVFGDGLVAVILSGMGNDGEQGVRVAKAAGGTTIVQDEATSSYFAMPHAALLTGSVDRVLAPNAIAAFICAFAEARP